MLQCLDCNTVHLPFFLYGIIVSKYKRFYIHVFTYFFCFFVFCIHFCVCINVNLREQILHHDVHQISMQWGIVMSHWRELAKGLEKDIKVKVLESEEGKL